MMRAQQGFTLVELVIVVVLLGVLTAIAVPSLSGTRAIDDARFVHEVRDALRYAQRSAIAQRRSVCVTFTSSSVSFSIATSSGAACSAALTGPGGEASFGVTASNAGFSGLPTDFTFDALGAASTGQTLLLPGASIVVDAVTGYVR